MKITLNQLKIGDWVIISTHKHLKVDEFIPVREVVKMRDRLNGTTEIWVKDKTYPIVILNSSLIEIQDERNQINTTKTTSVVVPDELLADKQSPLP